MKRILLIVSAVSFLWLPRSFAFVDLGLVGGLSLATQTVSSNSYSTLTYSPKPYLSGGLLGTFKLPLGNWAITSGLLYTQLGTHQEYSVSGFYAYNTDVKAPYLQIPVTMDYWFLNLFSLGGGFYLGFPGGNVTESGTQILYGVPYNVNTSRSFSDSGYINYDYGVLLHGQVKVQLEEFFLTGHVYYEIGLQDISASNASTINNQALLVLVGGGIHL